MVVVWVCQIPLLACLSPARSPRLLSSLTLSLPPSSCVSACVYLRDTCLLQVLRKSAVGLLVVEQVKQLLRETSDLAGVDTGNSKRRMSRQAAEAVAEGLDDGLNHVLLCDALSDTFNAGPTEVSGGN